MSIVTHRRCDNLKRFQLFRDDPRAPIDHDVCNSRACLCEASPHFGGNEFLLVQSGDKTIFTKVTESRLKGEISERSPDGKTRSGTYETTKESESKSSTLVQWKGDGGKTESVKGSFTRLD